MYGTAGESGPQPDRTSMEHLARGENWTCPECQRTFTGTLGAKPPSTAPPRWCRGCKRTKKLAHATCGGCTFTWNHCRCHGERIQTQRMLNVTVKSTRNRTADDPDESFHHPPGASGSALPAEGVDPVSGCQQIRSTRCQKGNEGKGVGDSPQTPGTGYPSGNGAATQPAKQTLTQQCIRQYGNTQAYWEQQEEGALCGVHAVNCMVQRRAVDCDHMLALAAALDQREGELLSGEGGALGDRNARPDGDFTVQVLQEALHHLDGGGGVEPHRY